MFAATFTSMLLASAAAVAPSNRRSELILQDPAVIGGNAVNRP